MLAGCYERTTICKCDAVERCTAFQEWNASLRRTVKGKHGRRDLMLVVPFDGPICPYYGVINARFAGNTFIRPFKDDFRAFVAPALRRATVELETDPAIVTCLNDGEGHSSSMSIFVTMIGIGLPPLVTSDFLMRPPVSFARSSSTPRY